LNFSSGSEPSLASWMFLVSSSSVAGKVVFVLVVIFLGPLLYRRKRRRTPCRFRGEAVSRPRAVSRLIDTTRDGNLRDGDAKVAGPRAFNFWEPARFGLQLERKNRPGLEDDPVRDPRPHAQRPKDCRLSPRSITAVWTMEGKDIRRAAPREMRQHRALQCCFG